MAFFPRAFHHPTVSNTPTEASFTPLFRLLDDFDSYSRQAGRNCSGPRHVPPQWQPKFDIRETAEAYELHGEFPGMSKENVHIEFTDPQTIHISGKTERTYTAGTPPTGQFEDAAKSGAVTEGEGEEHKNPHQATVEDEDEASERESGFEVVAKEDDEKTEETTRQKPVDRARYWITERSIGAFSRGFHFPSRVEQDAVTAGFKDGILSITVPKAKKHEPRRIAIN